MGYDNKYNIQLPKPIHNAGHSASLSRWPNTPLTSVFVPNPKLRRCSKGDDECPEDFFFQNDNPSP